MADATTANFGWTKPNVNDPSGQDAWGGKINADLDGIDSTVFAVQTTANAPTNVAGGFVNRLRNGTFDVWQRGTSFTAPATGAYTADGWMVTWLGAAPATVIRNPLGSTAPMGGASYMAIVGATGNTQLNLVQRIESYVAAQLGNAATVTFSCWAISTVAVTPTISVTYPSAVDSGPYSNAGFSGALQAMTPNTWTRLAYTGALPAGAAQNGLQLGLTLGAYPSGTFSIAAADLRATPGLPVGLCANPPPPELRPIHEELAFCQRYYEVLGNLMIAFNSWAAAGWTTQSAFYKVTKRVVPTVTYTPGSTSNYTSTTLQASGISSFQLQVSATAAGATSVTYTGITASAEL